MAYKAPGKHYRKGLTPKEFFKLFPDDNTAEAWFVAHRWPDGIRCPHCGSDNVNTASKNKTMPYRCRKSKKKGGCGRDFSTKTGTFMECSKVGFQDWLFAMYLIKTNLKGVSSMKLHRELDKTQKAAWHLAHRIRKALSSGDGNLFTGPAEVDETYVGGRRRNMSNARRKELTGRGPVGKVAVVGVKDRSTNRVSARVVPDTTGATLQRFILGNVVKGTEIYTDDATAYLSLPQPCGCQALGWRVCSWPRSHQRDRELLGNPETGAQRHLPSTQFKAPPPLRR